MGKLTRMISKDGSVMVCAVDSTDICGEIERIHQTSAVVTAALGRLTTAASIMGYNLKSEGDSLTLRIKADGPTGTLTAVSDWHGNVKASVDNPIVEIPLNPQGKLDVRGAVGTNGALCVIRDLGLKEPYVGQVPLISGEIAEDITNYYATSEQIPTVCGLGVLVNPDLTVRAAGGYLIQLLPFADENCIGVIEQNLKEALPVSAMIDSGMSPLDICRALLNHLDPDVLEEDSVAYKCDCNRKRVEKILQSLERKELVDMHDEDDGCEVCCHFCNTKYNFSAEELQMLIARKDAVAQERAGNSSS